MQERVKDMGENIRLTTDLEEDKKRILNGGREGNWGVREPMKVR